LRKHIPAATYRLQFNSQFTFSQAEQVAGYLADLGISDCYASPLFQATAESTHGYDICRFDQFNPHLGNTADFEHWAARLREFGLGLLLDMVPNHMGNDVSNRWWLDVLEKGQASAFASYFDIQHQFVAPELQDKVLLPILEDHFAKVLEAAKLQLVFWEGTLSVAYYERRFPLCPASYTTILRELVPAGGADPKTAGALERLPALLEALGRMDVATEAGRLEFAKGKEQLRAWHRDSPEFRAALAAALRLFNGRAGNVQSFERLAALLDEQHYRLAFWRVGEEELNYRRFFDITDLVSLRMELPQVFQATHQLVLRLLGEGKVSGLRIDHPDGLWDPRQYFRRIQENFRTLVETYRRERALTPSRSKTQTPLYVVAEKILTGNEPLPSDWPVDGTTGYDFLNLVNGLFVDGRTRESFDRIYRGFTRKPWDFRAMVYAGKKQILQSSLRSELNALTHRLKRVTSGTLYGRDFSPRQLRASLAAIIAAFPVYRTYISEDTLEVLPPERGYIEQAVEEARLREPRLDGAVVEFIRDLLLLRPPRDLDQVGRGYLRRFVMRFQQLSGPVMAKGLEDTVFYNFNRLISLNEVGGNPEAFGVGLQQFHEHNQVKARLWPHSLLATATHDTKRGEDVRARINVLSELPDAWEQALARWAELNAGKKTFSDAHPAPDANDEYLFYQTLIGAWPPEQGPGEPWSGFRDRVAAFMLKAIKEAKSHTNWTDPNEAYEEAVTRFVQATLDDHAPNPFLEDFRAFQRRVAFFGRFNSLSQVLLKMTSPGVPDFYQGTELWDLNLVDPDNRRPVDFETRRRLLHELKEAHGRASSDRRAWLSELLGRAHTGEIKLYLVWRALEFRRLYRALFERGSYRPLAAVGAKRGHVCAFARHHDGLEAVVVAPRLVTGLTGGVERPPLGGAVWQDTFLPVPGAEPGSRYRNVLTDEMLALVEKDGQWGLTVGQTLQVFPVAMLGKATA